MLSPFMKLLDDKLSCIVESQDAINHTDAQYDRQYAEDILFHTLGPLTDNPRWINGPWNSPNPEPEGYTPGGPAYSWTPDDVIFAFAGNPSKLFQGGSDSPGHGRFGGSPMLRLARRVARKFNKSEDKDFIADLYANGFVPLSRMMHPGADQGRSPFISFVMRSVMGAMESGPGAERSSLDVTADDRAEGKLGLRAALKTNDPAAVRAAAETVQGKYQTERSWDKTAANPFGQYSASYYQSMMAYADALESGDEDRIDAERSKMAQLIDTIQDANPQIRGAASGLGQAISNKDRKTSIGIASMDASKTDDGATLGDSLAGDDADEGNWLQPEAVAYILDIAVNYDIGAILPKDSKWKKMAAELGAKGGNIGGKMPVNELRYLIRSLGPIGSNYPGRDTMRSNTSVPRDARGWWQAGEDPEIEPMPNGGQWNSIWKRGGYAPMQPTAIANEMTQEVDEFNKIGIPTARKVNEKIDAKTGKVRIREAVSKVAVANTVRAARIKLQIIAAIHKDQLGLDESVTNNAAAGLFTDTIDRAIVVEHAEAMASILQESLVMEATSTAPQDIGLLKRILRELQKPARPADVGTGAKTGTGLTKALQYQDQLAKWVSKTGKKDSSVTESISISSIIGRPHIASN